MKKSLGNVARLLTCVCVLSGAFESRAAFDYIVTIQTSPLANPALSGNGPFSLDLQLNYGSGPFGNNATVNNFSFGGGSATGAPTLSGSASGNLNSAVTLSDNGVNGFNEFFQSFTPGSTLSFEVALSGNPTTTTPDNFAVAILDNTGGQIVTTDPNDGLSLATFEIGSFGAITTHAYSGIDNTDPNNLVDLGDYSGVTVSIVPVPEPSTIAAGLLALALVGAKILPMRRDFLA